MKHKGSKLVEMILAGPPKEPDSSDSGGDREDAFDDFDNKSLPKNVRMDALALFIELSE